MSMPKSALVKKGGGGGGSASTSVSYDYSAQDEARAAKAKAKQIEGSVHQAAYDGKIGDVMSSAHAIRGLQNQAKEAASVGPRVKSVSARATAPTKSTTSMQYDNRPIPEGK